MPSHDNSKKLGNEATGLNVPLKKVNERKKSKANDLRKVKFLDCIPVCERCDNKELRKVGFWFPKTQWLCGTCLIEDVNFEYDICSICQHYGDNDFVCDFCEAGMCTGCWRAIWTCPECEETVLCKTCTTEEKQCGECEASALATAVFYNY